MSGSLFLHGFMYDAVPFDCSIVIELLIIEFVSWSLKQDKKGIKRENFERWIWKGKEEIRGNLG